MQNISRKYLGGQNYNVTIYEEEGPDDSTRKKLAMSEFLTKMVATALIDGGASPVSIERSLKAIEASPEAFPTDKSISVLSYQPVLIFDGKSKIPAER